MTNKTLTTQPAGMVLVPREPTEEMRRAAHDVFGNPLSKRCYSAMLAAAPAQPAAPAVERKPLTADEIQTLWSPYRGAAPFSFARAIEKAHGIGGGK